MKGLRIVTILSLAIGANLAISAEPAAKDFFVSKAVNDQATLKRVYEKISSIEAAERPRGQDFEIVRIIDTKQFVVFKRFPKITGSPTGDGVPVTKDETDYETAYWLVSAEPMDAKDGEILRDLHVTESTETKTDIAGTYHILKIVTTSEAAFTKENFLFHLKTGRTWLLPQFGVEKCTSCFGDGKLGALQKFAMCPDCGGAGSFKVDYRVRW
jgi:hypothetical protein